MSEIKKISVDGVVYDIAASTSENPGEGIQAQIDDLNKKTEELDKKISSEASRVDGMIDQVNENTASSIETLNNNLVQAINTINGGISAEVISREEGDKTLQESINKVQEDLEAIGNPAELVEAEKQERKDEDAKLSEKIDSSVKDLNETIAEVNSNVASSIEILNNNLVQAINTINGGIDNEIRPELEKAVKYQEFEDGTRKTIQLANHDTISGVDTEGNGYNLAMISKWNKADYGSSRIPMNLNSSNRITVNDSEELAYVSEIATKEEVQTIGTKVEENATKIDEVNNNLTGEIESTNEAINTKVEEINTRIDTEVIQKINDLDNKKVNLVEADKNGIKTLNIVLDNYASLIGKDTQGILYNLAMVSKWNKADYGSASLPLNLNGSEERPTYNDDVELALLSDVTGNLDSINLVKKGDLEYELQVGDRIAGTINIPEDQFLKSFDYNGETHVLTLVFKTEEGEKPQEIDLSGLIDVYTSGNGLALDGNSFSIKISPNTESYIFVDESGVSISGIDAALAEKADVTDLNSEVEARTAGDTQLQEDLQAEAQERINKDTEIEAEVAKKVDFVDVASEELPDRKAIVLPKQGDVILSGTEDIGNISLIQYNRWGIVDLGTSTKPINLNTPAGVRPTVQEAGQSGEEAYKIAYTSDLENLVTSEDLAEEANTARAAEQANSEAINTLDSKAVKYTDITTEENPGRKSIVLENHDTILGKTTEGEAKNLIMMSKWNKADVGSGDVELNLNGSAEHPTYNDSKEIAFLEDIDKLKSSVEVRIPIRTLKDEVYDKATILGEWFGVEDEVALKGLINRKGQFYLRFGIVLSGNPYNYKMPIQYIAFESATQLKLVFTGLDTSDDAPTKYEILINLDGTIIEGNSNIKVTMSNLAMESSIPSLSGYATENWVNEQGYLTEHQDITSLATKEEVNQQISSVNSRIDEIKIPTKVSELENDSEYQTKSDVDARIEAIVGAAPEALDTLEEIANKLSDNDDVVASMTSEISTKASQSELDSVKNDLSQFKSPYQVDLNKLNSASDSESISDAIGGIDNLRNVVSENRTVIGDINNGTVPVSIRILGNITTVYYVLDSLAGYTLNEINIQNTDGVLSKNSVTHSVMSEEMVVDNLTSSETTLPLSANQGRILDEKIKKNGMYYQGVKVDTQKLFALTKDSSEDEIKAALQMETSSGSYTLPTAAILDDCLGKGYMLNSNWMPVSVAWNGAAYVFYITGQTYMNQPASLAQVSIRIQDGVYSVFQAAKINKFALEKDIPENIATLSDGKHLNLPIDGSITAVQDSETSSTGVLLCQRTYDEGVSYVTEVGNVRNKLTLNSTERPQIDLAGGTQEKISYQSDLVEYQKVDGISFEDTYETAKGKLANGVKTITDDDGLIWTINEAIEDEIAGYQGVKIAASRMKSSQMDADGIDSNTGFIYASFQRTTNGDSWSKVLSTYELVNNIDANINGNNIATTKFVDSYLINKLCGDINVLDYLENGYEVQIINKLEQTYIDDLGTPENINGKAYNAETNNYTIGQPYISFAKFDESLTFHYDLFILNNTINTGCFGAIYNAIKLNMDSYDSKLSKLEERLKALEESN